MYSSNFPRTKQEMEVIQGAVDEKETTRREMRRNERRNTIRYFASSSLRRCASSVGVAVFNQGRMFYARSLKAERPRVIFEYINPNVAISRFTSVLFR